MTTPIPRPRRGVARSPAGRIGGLVTVAVLAAIAGAGPAAAQTSGELRRENARLREAVADREAEVRTLQARLAELLGEVSRLTARVAELEAAAAARPGGTDAAGRGADEAPAPAAAEPVITVDESVADASPTALRRAAQRRWAAGPGTLERGADARSPDRTNYLRSAAAWVRDQNRSWSVSVDWLVRLVPVEGVHPEAAVWTMQAHDPVSDARLGPPFEVRVRRSIARRLERRLAEDPGDPPRLRLRGPVVMRFAVDPARPEPGPFDRPPLLAPFVTFEFGIEARSLDPEVVPAPPATDTEPAPEVPAPPAGPASGGGASGG